MTTAQHFTSKHLRGDHASSVTRGGRAGQGFVWSSSGYESIAARQECALFVACILRLPCPSPTPMDGTCRPGGVHCSQVQEEEEEVDMKMMIEPAVRGPGSEHEKLFVRWSGRRSVMARIG